MPSCFVGLVLENCNLPYANHGHVILADPSPILCYPISSTEVRCLVDVPGQKVPSISNGEMAKYLKTVVAPQVHTCCTPSQSFFSFATFSVIHLIVRLIDHIALFCRCLLKYMMPLLLQLIRVT